MKNRKITKYILTALALFTLSGGMGAWAAIITWDGGGLDGLWGTANNWNPNTVPVAGDDVIIPLAENITTPAAATTIKSLLITAGATINLDGDLIITANDWGANNNLDFESGGVIVNLNNHAIDAGMTLYGSAAIGSSISINGPGSFTTERLDASDDFSTYTTMTNGVVYTISNIAYLDYVVHYFMGDGTPTVNITGTVFNNATVDPLVVFDGVTVLNGGADSYIFNTTGSIAAGQTITVNITGSFAQFSQFTYTAIVTDNDGTTDESYTIPGATGSPFTASVTTAQTLPGSAPADDTYSFTIQYPGTVDTDDGVTITVYPFGSTLPIGTVAFSQSSTTNVWLGTTNAWGTGTNWSQGSIPNAGDDVVIPQLGAGKFYPLASATIPAAGSIASLTIDTDASCNLNGQTMNVTGSITNNGTLTLTGGESIAGTRVNGPSSTVVYAGAAMGPSAWGSSYRSLTINGGSSLSLGATDITVPGTLTVNGQLNLNGAGNVSSLGTLANNGTVELSSSGTITKSDTNSGIFQYTGGWAGTIPALDGYYDLVITGGAHTQGNALTVNNDLTISGGSLSGNGNPIAVTGSITGAGTLTGGAETITVGGDFTPATFSQAGGTLELNGTVASFAPSGSIANLTLGASADVTLGGNVTLTGALDNSAGGTLNANNRDISVAGSFTNGGTFTSGTGTVTMTGTGNLTGFTGASAIRNLIINAAGTITLGSSILVAGDGAGSGGNVTITAGTLKALSYGITLDGDWSNGGTFTYDTGTVTFWNLNGDTAHAIDGTNTFYNLTCSGAAASLTFPSGVTTTIAPGGLLTLGGASTGARLTLGPSAAATTWTLDVRSNVAPAVQYLTVTYCDLVSSNGNLATNLSPTGSSGGMGNDSSLPMWILSTSYTWNGPTPTTTWNDAANWTPNTGYPVAGDDVTIPDLGATLGTPEIPAGGISLKNLTMASGAKLGLAGKNLTVTGTLSKDANATILVHGDEVTVSPTTLLTTGITEYNGTAATYTIADLGATDYETLRINSGVSEYTFSNDLDVSGAITVVQSNGVIFPGTVDATSLTVTNTNTATAIRADGALAVTTFSPNAGPYNLELLGGGNVTNSVTFLNAGTVQIGDAAGDSFTFDGGIAGASATGGLRLAGTIAATNDPLNLNDNVTLYENTTLQSGSGAMTIGGTVDSATGTNYNLTVSSTTGTLTWGGAIGSIDDIGALEVSVGSTIPALTITGNLTLNGGTTALANAAHSIGGNVTGAGTLNAIAIAAGSLNVDGSVGVPAGTAITAFSGPTSGSFTVGGGWNVTTYTNNVATITLDGATASVTLVSNGQTLGPITVFKSNTTDAVVLSGDLTCGQITLTQGILDADTNNVNISCAGFVDASANAGFSGTGQTVTVTGGSLAGPDFSDLTIAGAVGSTGAAIIAGNLFLSSGTLALGTQDLSVAGNVTRTSGIITSTGTTGTITLNGAGGSPQTADFSGVGSTIPNLAINKTGGSSVVQLNNTAAFTWNGGLSFTAGTLELPDISQTIGGNVTGTGTLDADAITGTLTVSGSVGTGATALGTLLAPAGTIQVGANWRVGTLTNPGAGTRVVEFTGDGTIYSTSAFINLTKSGAGTNTGFMGARLTASGNVYIPSGTLTLADNAIAQTVGGDITGAGTFDADAITALNTLSVTGSIGSAGTPFGTLRAPAGTIQVSGSYFNVSSVVAGTGTIEFTKAAAPAQTIIPNGQTFNAVSMTGGSGVGMEGTATFATLSIGNGEAFTLGGASVTTLTLSGSGANVLTTGNASGGLRWNAASASSTLSFSGAAPEITNGTNQGLQVTSGANNASLTATNTVTLLVSELDPNGNTLRVGNFTTAVPHTLVNNDILTLTGAATFSGGLTLNGNATTRVNVGTNTLTVASPTITYGTMTVSTGEIAAGATTLGIGANGTLTSTGASTLGAGAVSNTGTIDINTTSPSSWSVSGNFTSTGIMTNDVAYTIGVGGDLAISGTYDISPLPTFTMSGTGNTVNTVTQIGNLTTSGTASITAATSQLKLAGSLTLGANTTLDLATFGASIAGSAGGTAPATLDGGGATGASVNIDGDFSVPSYTATAATTTIAGTTVTFANLTHSSGTITLDGTATPVALTTGSVTFDKLTLSSASAKTVNVTGTLTTESAGGTGTLTVGTNCTLSVGNNTTDIGGSTTNDGTITLGAAPATFTFRGSVDSSPGTLTCGTGTVNLNGGLDASGGAFTASSGTTNVGLSLAAGTALSLPAAPNFNANGGTIVFNGSSPGTVTFATNGQTLNNLTIDDNAATKTVRLNGNLTVGGTLEVEANQTLDAATNNAQLSVTGATNATAGNFGTITANNGALSFTGNFEINNLTASTGNTTFRGNVTLHTFSANTGTVVFAGTSATPAFTPNGATFNAISVTRTAGTLSTANNATGNFTVASYNQTGTGGTFEVAAGATMTMAASGSVTVSSGRLNLYGPFANATASVTVNGAAPNGGQVYAQGLAFSVSSLTVTDDGQFSQAGDNGGNAQTVGNLTVSVNGVCVWDSGNNGGTLTITGDLAGTTNLNFHYKNVTFGGILPLGILSGTVRFMDLYIPAGRTVSRFAGSNLTVLRHLTIEDSGRYVHNGRPLTLGGTVPFAITIGTIDDRNTGANPLQNLGAVTLAAGGAGTVKTLAHPMRAASVGVDANVTFALDAYNLTDDGNLSVTGSLTVANLASQTIDVGGDLTAGTLNFTGASPSVNVAGDMSLGTLTAGSSTFILDGTGDQTINANAQNFYNLTINTRGSGTVTFDTTALNVTNGTAGQGLVIDNSGGNYNITIGSGGTAANATTFYNTGTLTISAGYAFTLGVTHTAGATSLAGTLSTTNAAVSLDDLALGGDAAIDTVTAGTGGNISIGGDVTNATAYTLGLTAGTAGDISVTGSVGSGTALGAITVNSANDTTFDSTINAASLAQTTGTGTTTFHGNVTTGGNAAVDLTANAIAIDSASGVTFQANGATGTVFFRSPVTISSGPATVSTLTQGVTVTSAINGAQALTVHAGTTTARPASFQGAIGATTPLASLEISGSTVGLVDVGTALADGVSGTVNVSGTDVISLSGANYYSLGAQTWTSPSGVRYLATANGTWTAGGTGITLNATDLFLDHNGRTLTLGCNLSCRNLYFYRGILNSPGVTIRSTNDIALFGAAYDVNDPEWDGNADASIADADDWRFAYYGAATLNYYPGGGAYANGVFSALPNAAFQAGIATSIVVDYDGNGAGNFYANGMSLAAITLSLAVPANGNSAPTFNNGIAPTAAQWGIPYATAFYLDGTGATVSGGWLAGCPAQGVTATGAGNWQFARPTIATAETIYDDVVRLTFSMPVENTNGEINAVLALGAAIGDNIDDGSVWLNYAGTHYRFPGAYQDAKCTTALPAGDVTSFYVKTSGARWNTDATGSSAGDTDASDGTASTDRGRAGIAPATQTVVPDLAFLEGLFRAADGKTMCRNYGANVTAQYTATLDRCAPVLIEAFTGQEAHLAADSDAAQAPYDGHNFIEFRWSEPVVVPGVLSSATNVLATTAAGMVAQSGSGLDVAGIGIIASGTLSSASRAHNTTTLASATHALYRRFSLSGGAIADHPQRLRVSIAGYAETGASHGESYAWYWPGFVTAAATPSGAVTASATTLAIADVAANVIDDIVAGTYDRAAVTLSSAVSGLYGSWDVTGPAPAALRTASDAWGDEIVAYEAVPDTTGGIIDRIEMHLFDNEVSYNVTTDPWAWYSRRGWYDSADTTRTVLTQPSAAAPESFGGSRPLVSPTNAYVPTSGGIRESSLNQALGAFRVFYNDVIMGSLPTAFSTNVSTKLLAPGLNQNVAGDPYFRLYWPGAGGSGYQIAGAALTLSYNADGNPTQGYVTDLAGNVLKPFSKIKCVDRTAPRITFSLAGADRNDLYVLFSKPIEFTDPSEIAAGLAVNLSGTQVALAGTPEVRTANKRAFLYRLANPVTAANLVSPSSAILIAGTGNLVTDPVTGLTSETSYFVDELGNYAVVGDSHRLSDIGIGLVDILYGSDGVNEPGLLGTDGGGALRPEKFDGTGRLLDKDITIATKINLSAAPGSLSLYYDVNPDENAMPKTFNEATGSSLSLWLPSVIPGFNQAGDQEARNLSPVETTKDKLFRNFLIPESDAEVVPGAKVQFLLQYEGLFCAKLTNENDITSLAPWSFVVAETRHQRGGVTILNNVINSDKREKTILQVEVAKAGSVVIQVFTLDGNIVKVLERGRKGGGTYSYYWDGTNGAGNPVTRGIYFIRVVGPDMDEIRKVLVVRD